MVRLPLSFPAPTHVRWQATRSDTTDILKLVAGVQPVHPIPEKKKHGRLRF